MLPHERNFVLPFGGLPILFVLLCLLLPDTAYEHPAGLFAFTACHLIALFIHLGPDYGYFPNAAKTCFIVKPCFVRHANALFRGTGDVITDAGRHHLGFAVGSDDFVNHYVQDKVSTLVAEIEKLLKLPSLSLRQLSCIVGLVFPRLFVGPLTLLMMC